MKRTQTEINGFRQWNQSGKQHFFPTMRKPLKSAARPLTWSHLIC